MIALYKESEARIIEFLYHLIFLQSHVFSQAGVISQVEVMDELGSCVSGAEAASKDDRAY